MCARSLRKILPPTSQSKPEHPKLSTLEQSPVEAFVFPDYLSNPHLSEASLRTPRVSRTPTGSRAQSHAIVYLLADPTGKTHPPGPPRHRTAQTRRLSLGLDYARQGIPGVRASSKTDHRDVPAPTPGLDGDALPAPTRLQRGKCRRVDQPSAA